MKEISNIKCAFVKIKTRTGKKTEALVEDLVRADDTLFFKFLEPLLT